LFIYLLIYTDTLIAIVRTLWGEVMIAGDPVRYRRTEGLLLPGTEKNIIGCKKWKAQKNTETSGELECSDTSVKRQGKVTET